MLISGQGLHALAGAEQFENYLAKLPGIGLIFLLWGGLALAGLGWFGRQFWLKLKGHEAGWELPFILLVWFLGSPLLFSLPFLPVELHYLLPIYPAPYIAAGVFFTAVLERLPRWRVTSWGVFGLSAVVQGWAWLSLLSLVGQQVTPGAYGTPVKFHLQAATDARQLLMFEEGGEILVAGLSERPEEGEFAAVYDVLLRDAPHRVVDTSHSALFPEAGTVVLLSQDAGETAVAAYLEQASQVRRLPLREGEGVLQLATLSAGTVPEPEVAADSAVLFANWINIVGYDPLLPQADGMAVWQIYWQSGANPDPADYHFFNHLIDEEGQRIGQEDAAVFAPWQWRAGDLVVSFFNLDWAGETAASLTMRTGVYRYPSLENVPLLDVAGNPAGDAVEFSLGGE
jgi:hypothetical protein